MGILCLPKRVPTQASSSESLESTKASLKQCPLGCIQRSCINLWHKIKSFGHGTGGLGTYTGVLIPTCENMWGVLIFLRFFYIVGSAGVWQTFLIVFISFLCAMLTTMSLSAIATNGPIEQGGTYYLISRALGPKAGGAVGLLYYIGVVLLSVLEALGSVEMIVFTFPSLGFPSTNRAIGAIILIVLGLLVFFRIKFVSKLGLAFFLIVLYTMLSFYMGLGVAPRGKAPPSLTGLSWTTFKNNWSPGYPPGKSFSTAVSLFFPCFTGILSGADRATSLRRPEKSIPSGTLGAVMISFVMYLSYMGLWAAVGTREYLLGNTGEANAMLMVVRDVAFPLAILTQLGIIIASIAQAMQCLIISPRLLQAIAGDGAVPFLGPLAKISKNGEPRRALMVTTALSVAFAMMGSLNAVAPLVSICFLTCYSALNLSCFVFSAVNAPSWRPKWKYYHWSAALVGFLACAAMNFVIVWYWALVAIVFLLFVYVYIDFRQVEVNWGTGLGGLCLQIAVRAILSVGDEARYTVNWRPQLLCLSKPRSSWNFDGHAGYEFLFFTSQLKKGQGLSVVTVVLEGKLEEMTAQAAAEKIDLENRMNEAKVIGFGRVLVAPTYREGKTYAIQSSGLGSLEPNTLVLGWPTKWLDGGHEDSAQILLETLTECRAVDKAVLLCMHLNQFPSNDDPQEGVVDVWWIVHDGGLLLLLAHLLQQHKIWRKCKLRVHTVAEKLDNSEEVKTNLEILLETVRIEAEVQVLELDESYLAPYTFDYTLRVEQARAFAEEVAHYRRSIEWRGNAGSENISRQTSGVRTGDQLPPASNNKAHAGEVPKSGERAKDGGMPSFHVGGLDGGASHSRRRELRLGSSGVPALNFDSTTMEKGSVKESTKVLTVPKVPHIIPPYLPVEAPSTAGNPDIPSTSMTLPPKSISSTEIPSSLAEEKPATSVKTADTAPLEGTSVVHNTFESGQPEYGISLQPSQSATETATLTKRTDRKAKKGARWADEEGHSLDGRSSSFEILVKNGLLASGPDIKEDPTDPESLRHGNSSQVYPGSPAGIDASIEVPEPMRRTWETFSQSYAPKKLNDIIVEQSRDAQLVLMNLPDHYRGMEPNRYMEYCENLCVGLQRVLLVHGTGKELWGGQAHLGL